MSIISKIFGSKKKDEEQAGNNDVLSKSPKVFDDPGTQVVVFKNTPKSENLPKEIINPETLSETIRYVVDKWGKDYLQNRGFINVLNDFKVLKDIPAAKHILTNMQSNGYIEKIAQAKNWELESKSISIKYADEFGAREDIVDYIVKCIGYGLKFSEEKPVYAELSTSVEALSNNAPSQNIPNSQQQQQPSLKPYDPKLDLESYHYPTLDLLADYDLNGAIISLKGILSSSDYLSTSMQLPCAIGLKENGEVLMFDLVDNPHIMVSGSSGMGVSIFFNTLITSLLYKKHPAEVKFVMVDPKKIEFSLYKPLEHHFLASVPNNEPIITDMSSVTDIFISLAKEIDSRQELLSKASVRSIKDYNKKFCDRKLNPNDGYRYLPYIILLIDEYDELTRMCGRLMESSLEKITKMGRATGICVVLSILRPVGTVISSAIKANMFGRISFRVPSPNDSRNILGQSGAEKLQRPGDMIFSDGISFIKGRCAYMELSEVERINDYIKNQQGYLSAYELPDPNEEEPLWPYQQNDIDMQHLDPLFEDVARLIVREQSGSTSLVQRKFAIGYHRANRLMDQLEKAGVVGAAFGSKPREVMIQDERSLNNILASLR